MLPNLLLLFAFLVAPGSISLQQRGPPDIVVFRNVNIVPMDREIVLREMTVVVRDGVIIALGSSGQIVIANDAQVIEGRGGYLLPGLMDMHTHMDVPQLPAPFREQQLGLYLANGVTTVRNLFGYPRQVRWRDAIERGELLGPRIYVSSPMFEGRYAQSPRTARQGVRDYAAAGYDVIKVVRVPGPGVFEAIMEEANRLGIRVVGHVPDLSRSLADIVNSGMQSLEHVYELGWISYVGDDDPEAMQRAVETIRVSGVTVGTLFANSIRTRRISAEGEAIFESKLARRVQLYSGDHGMQVLARMAADRPLSPMIMNGRYPRPDVEDTLRFIQLLCEAGVNVVLGCDSFLEDNVPGFAVHDELDMFIAAGLSPYQALRTATVNPARLLGREHDLGVIQVGGAADLVLAEDNPLDDLETLRDPAGVMVRGRWLDRAELAGLLEQAAYDADPGD